MRIRVLASIAIVVSAVTLRAQENATPPEPTVTLVAESNWSWQCDPLRFAVRVTGKKGATLVRTKREGGDDALFPFAVERRDGEVFTPVRLDGKGRAAHPARCLTPSNGLRIVDDAGLLLEAELWHFDVVSKPGRIRVRFQVQVADATAKDAPSIDVFTPWHEIEIRAHAGNAAHLLGDSAAAERAACETMMSSINGTWTAQRHFGPTNLGPRLPSLRSWQSSVPVAERLVADAATSFRLRARARLVLAYDAIERAMRANGAARDDGLRLATAHLEANEIVASAPSGGLEALPSGGFEPLRLMLLAAIDGARGERDPRVALDELRERYPFFAMWWRDEAAELLGRSR